MAQNKFSFIERLMIAITLTSFLLILLSVMGDRAGIAPQSVAHPTNGWYYYEDGQKISVSLPASLSLPHQDSLTLYNDNLAQRYAGQSLTTKAALYHIIVRLNNTVLYQYSDDQFPRNDQMSGKFDCDITLPAIPEGKTLSITYENRNHDVYSVNAIYAGNSEAIFLHHLGASALPIGIVFFTAILSVISIGVSIYLKRIRLQEKRFTDTAFFVLICGIWCATDSSIIQHLTNLSPVTNYISFYAFMILAIPMLHFLKNTGELHKYRRINICICLFYANAAIQGLLNYYHIFDMIDMLFITHLLLIGSIIAVTLALIKEYKREANNEIFTILVSFAVVAAGGILSLFLYWVFEINYYDTIFECSIFLFILMLFCRIVITTAENLRFKTEAIIYRRLSKEDGLTGMNNRRAFEEYLTEIEETADEFENAMLIFMDINKLKYYNDNYGHSAGDELIIAAAHCIEKAFSVPGSTCFRIGGDEFCTILTNPTNSETYYMNHLEQEIALYNLESRFSLSISSGISLIRDEDGKLKTISDWKYEADQKMYSNKGWRKINDYNK